MTILCRCSSVNSGSATDLCQASGTGRFFIKVAWWSGTPAYTLSITSP